MKTSPRVYAKTKSRSTMKGDWYEVKVAALLYLRSLNTGQFLRFQLATNVDGAGALDDIVHRWSATGDEATPTWHTTLVQLKHKERSLLRMGSFTGTRGDFALRRYLTSYAEIKKAKRDGVHDNSSLLGGETRHFRLVIYTNARAEKTIVKRKVGSSETGSILEELLKSNAEDELIFKFDKEIDEEVFSCLEADDDDEETTTEFFDKLTVFSGQPTESQLDDVIKKELSIACGGAVTDAGAIYRIFEGMFKRWWRDSDHVLDENSAIVQRAVDQLSAEAELTRQTHRCTLDLGFDERTWPAFNTSFAEGVSLLHVVTAETSLKLSATKVLCLLYAEKLSFTFTSLEYLLHHKNDLIPDWRDGYKDCLVVVSDGLSERESREALASLSEYVNDILDGNPNKKTILVSRHDCQLAVHLKDKIKYKVLEDKFDFADLDQPSRDKVFGTEVTFQGCTLSWKCLYDSDVSFWKTLYSDSLMESLLSGHPMTLGAQLPCIVQHFIPRRLKRHSVLDEKFLKAVTSSPDVAVVSGSREEDTTLQFDHAKEETESETEGMVLYTTQPEEKYEEMCRAHSNVHRLHWDGEVLHWVQSKGDMLIVSQFVDRSNPVVVESESVMVKDDKVVLVIAEPGMGKTTLMLALAQTVKKANPAQWVVHINLRDHSELFNRSPQLDAVDFLTLALGIDLPLEKTFLRASLERTGNVVVILDSFDEICPRYELEGCGLLTSLLETRVGKAVVTSRHCMQQVLEKHLSTLAYNIVEFTADDQKMFFRKFWAGSSSPMTSDRLEVFIAQLMDAVNAIDPERQLMQVPLQTMMLAEVFHDAAMDPDNNALPRKLDTLNLFEQFVDKKFSIFFRKGFINLNRSDSKFSFLENHKHAALTLFVPEEHMQGLNSNQNIVANAEMFLNNIEGAKYNSGLVLGVVNRKPVFLHQMFAEYFAGTWFTEHYRSNREFLSEFLFHPNYAVVRVMFDRVLARGLALHEATLDGDLETLSSSDADVDARDAGGRTPLHLAAALGLEAAPIDSSYRVNRRHVGPRCRHAAELLAARGARTDAPDDVFHWTPLQYAAKTGSWGAMEYLLCAQPGDVTSTLPLTTPVTDGTMLKVVFAYGYVKVLDLLLQRGLSVNHSMYRKCLMHYACQYGYLDMVELLLSRGADKRATDYNGNVALHIASRFGHLSVVRTLLQNKPREKLSSLLNSKNKIRWFDRYVNILNAEKDSALHFAMTADIVRLLVSHGGDLWRRDKIKKTCLHTAAWFGRLSVADAILAILRANRKDVIKYVNMVDIAGISATCYAARNGHADITRLLVANGANVRMRDNMGRTCLHYASTHEEALAIVQSLAGRDRGELVEFINTPDTKGQPALILACIAGRDDVVRLLTSLGADVWARDTRDRTSLHFATDGDLVRALIASFGDDEEEVSKYLDTVDNAGSTALMLAARIGHAEIARLLVAHGASVWPRDVRGRTCLHVAAEEGCLPVAEALVASLHEADVLRYVIAQDSSGLSARDLATRPPHLDRYAWNQDARGRLAIWLDEITERVLNKDLPNTPTLQR